MLTTLLTSNESTSEKIEHIKKLTSSPEFLEILQHPNEFLNTVIPFAQQVFKEIPPDKSMAFGQQNEMRVFFIRLLARFDYKQYSSEVLMGVIYELLGTENIFNRYLTLRILTPLLSSEIPIDKVVHLRAVNTFFQNELPTSDSSDVSKCKLGLFSATEALNYLGKFQSRYRLGYENYEDILYTLTGALKVYYVQRFLEDFFHNKKVSIEFAQFGTSLFRFLNQLHLPNTHYLVPYFPELCFTLVNICPRDCVGLHCEVVETALATILGKKEVMCNVDKYFMKNIYWMADSTRMKQQNLRFLSEVMRECRVSLAKVVYIEFDYRIIEYIPTHKEVGLLTACTEAFTVNLVSALKYQGDLPDLRPMIFRHLKTAGRLYSKLHLPERCLFVSNEELEERREQTKNEQEQTENEQEQTKSIYEQTKSINKQTKSMIKKELAALDLTFLNYIKILIRAFSAMQMTKPLDWEEIQTLGRLLLFPLTRSLPFVEHMAVFCELPMEVFEHVVLTVASDLLVNYHNQLPSWNVLFKNPEIHNIFIRTANSIIHSDFVADTFHPLVFYQDVFHVAYGFFKLDKRIVRPETSEVFSFIYEALLFYDDSPLANRPPRIELVRLINTMFLDIKQCEAAYTGLYFIYDTFETTVTQLYTLYTLTFDPFYLECLFNVPVSLNLLITKYAVLIAPMMAGLRAGRKLREIIMKYVEYIVEFETDDVRMKDLLALVFELLPEHPMKGVNVLSRISNRHRDALGNEKVLRGALPQKNSIVCQKTVLFCEKEEPVQFFIGDSPLSCENVGSVLSKKVHSLLENTREEQKEIKFLQIPCDDLKRALIPSLTSYEFSYEPQDVKSPCVVACSRLLKGVEHSPLAVSSARAVLIDHLLRLVQLRETRSLCSDSPPQLLLENTRLLQSIADISFSLLFDSCSLEVLFFCCSTADLLFVSDFLADGLVYCHENSSALLQQVFSTRSTDPKMHKFIMRVVSLLVSFVYSTENLKSTRALSALSEFMRCSPFLPQVSAVRDLLCCVLHKLKRCESSRVYSLSFDFVCLVLDRYGNDAVLVFENSIERASKNEHPYTLLLAFEVRCRFGLSQKPFMLGEVHWKCIARLFTCPVDLLRYIENFAALCESFLRQVNKKDFSSLDTFTDLLERIRNDTRLFPDVLIPVKKYLPAVAVLVGFTSLEARRTFVENVNRNGNFQIQNPNSVKVFRNLFCDCRINTAVKGSVIEFANSPGIEHKVNLLEILLNSLEYDQVSFDFLVSKLSELHATDSARFLSEEVLQMYTTLWEKIAVQLPRLRESLLVFLVERMHVSFIYHLFITSVPLAADVSAIVNGFISEFMKSGHTYREQTRAVYNALRFLKRRGFHYHDNKAVLLVYRDLYHFESGAEDLVNWYFAHLNVEDIEVLYRINSSFLITSEALLLKMALVETISTRVWMLSCLKRQMGAVALQCTPPPADSRLKPVGCLNNKQAVDCQDFLLSCLLFYLKCKGVCTEEKERKFQVTAEQASEEKFEISSESEEFSESTVETMNSLFVDTCEEEGTDTHVELYESGVKREEEKRIKRKENKEDCDKKLSDSLFSKREENPLSNKKLNDLLSNKKLNDLLSNKIQDNSLSNRKQDNSLSNKMQDDSLSDKIQDNKLSNRKEDNSLSNRIQKEFMHDKKLNDSSSNKREDNSLSNKKQSDSLSNKNSNDSLSNNSTFYSLKDFYLLLPLFRDNISNVIELFCDLQIYAPQLVEFCKSAAQQVSYRYACLFYLAMFSPEKEHFEEVFRLSHHEGKYAQTTLRLLVEHFGAEVFVEQVKVVLRSEMRFGLVETVLVPFLLDCQVFLEDREIFLETCVFAKRLLDEGRAIEELLVVLGRCSTSHSSTSHSSTSHSAGELVPFLSSLHTSFVLLKIKTGCFAYLPLFDRSALQKTKSPLLFQFFDNDIRSGKSIDQYDRVLLVETFLSDTTVSISRELVCFMGLPAVSYASASLDNKMTVLEVLFDEQSLFDEQGALVLMHSLVTAKYSNTTRFARVYQQAVTRCSGIVDWLVPLVLDNEFVYPVLLEYLPEVLERATPETAVALCQRKPSNITPETFEQNILHLFKVLPFSLEVLKHEFFTCLLSQNTITRECFADLFLSHVPTGVFSVLQFIFLFNYTGLDENQSQYAILLVLCSRLLETNELLAEKKNTRVCLRRAELLDKYRQSEPHHVQFLCMYTEGSCNIHSFVRIVEALLSGVFSSLSAECTSYLFRVFTEHFNCSYRIKLPFYKAFMQAGCTVNDVVFNPFVPNLKFYSLVDRSLYLGLVKCTSGLRETKTVVDSLEEAPHNETLSKIFEIFKKVAQRQASYCSEDLVFLENEVKRLYCEHAVSTTTKETPREVCKQLHYQKTAFHSACTAQTEFENIEQRFVRMLECLENDKQIGEDVRSYILSLSIMHFLPRNTQLFCRLQLFATITSEIVESSIIMKDNLADSLFGRFRMWMSRQPADESSFIDWNYFMRWRSLIFNRAHAMVQEGDKKKINTEICKLNCVYSSKAFKEKLFGRACQTLNELPAVTSVEINQNMQRTLLDLENLYHLQDYNTMVALVNSLNITKFSNEEKSRLYCWMYKALRKLNRTGEMEKYGNLSRKLGEIVENKIEDLVILKEKISKKENVEQIQSSISNVSNSISNVSNNVNSISNNLSNNISNSLSNNITNKTLSNNLSTLQSPDINNTTPAFSSSSAINSPLPLSPTTAEHSSTGFFSSICSLSLSELQNAYVEKLIEVINELSLEESRKYVLELLDSGLPHSLDSISHRKLYFFIPQIKFNEFLFNKNPLLKSSVDAVDVFTRLHERFAKSEEVKVSEVDSDHKKKRKCLVSKANLLVQLLDSKNPDVSCISRVAQEFVQEQLSSCFSYKQPATVYAFSSDVSLPGEFTVLRSKYDDIKKMEYIETVEQSLEPVFYVRLSDGSLCRVIGHSCEQHNPELLQFMQFYFESLGTHKLAKTGARLCTVPQVASTNSCSYVPPNLSSISPEERKEQQSLVFSIHKDFDLSVDAMLNLHALRLKEPLHEIYSFFYFEKQTKSSIVALCNSISKFKNWLKDEILETVVDFNNFYVFKRNVINTYSFLLFFQQFFKLDCIQLHDLCVDSSGCVYLTTTCTSQHKKTYFRPNMQSVFGSEGINGPMHEIWKELLSISNEEAAKKAMKFFKIINRDKMELSDEKSTNMNVIELIAEMVDPKTGSNMLFSTRPWI